MTYILTTPPATSSLTVEQVKDHLRITGTVEDIYLQRLVDAAVAAAEYETDRAVMEQTWTLLLAAWPPDRIIRLVKCPVTAVNSIKYLDGDGTVQTLAESEYSTVLDAAPALITPAFGKAWPVVSTAPDAIQVEFDSGCAAAADVDARLVQGILLTIGQWYENREEIGDLSDAVKALFRSVTVWG